MYMEILNTKFLFVLWPYLYPTGVFVAIIAIISLTNQPLKSGLLHLHNILSNSKPLVYHVDDSCKVYYMPPRINACSQASMLSQFTPPWTTTARRMLEYKLF